MAGAFAYGMTPTNSPKGSAFQAVQPSVIPVGVIEMFAGSTAPNGWLVCDGSTVSRSAYSDLFKIIGTTYGAGNSNTTFTLPDMRGRTPIGVGTGSGLTARTLAATTGAETASLSEANLPSHAHSFTPSGSLQTESSHTHGSANAGSHIHSSNNSFLLYVGSGGGANLSGGTTYQIYNLNATIQSNGDHNHGSTNSNTGHTHAFTGSGGTTGNGNGTATAVSLMQPAIAINFIIKT